MPSCSTGLACASRLARETGIPLRQSYVRVGKWALIQHQRYAHAKQFKRAGRELRRLKTYLGRTLRDIERKIKGQDALSAYLRPELFKAGRVLAQKQRRRKHGPASRERGQKIYSLHAPEVECIGKGKAHKPYEFSVKVSVATTLRPSAGGQFVLNAKSLPGAPYDGHTLRTVIPAIEVLPKPAASTPRAIGTLAP